MKHIWTVLCRRGLVDARSNQVSLLEVAEEISVTVQPGVTLPDPTADETVDVSLELVTLWGSDQATQGQNGVERVRIVLVTPNDPQPVYQPEMNVDFQGGKRTRSFVGISAFLWRGPGVYRFRVEFLARKKWVLAAEMPFEVIVKMAQRPSGQIQARPVKPIKLKQMKVDNRPRKRR